MTKEDAEKWVMQLNDPLPGESSDTVSEEERQAELAQLHQFGLDIPE